MKELLDMENLKQSGWRPDNLEEPRLQQLQMKICRADHGAIIKVERLVRVHVGRVGICLIWKPNTIQLISTDNKLRIFPKKGTTRSAWRWQGSGFSFPGSPCYQTTGQGHQETKAQDAIRLLN